MRKAILTFISAIFVALGCFALSGDEIMKQTASKVASAPSLSIKFTATTGDGARTSGTLTIAKSCFTMMTDIQSVWFDGKTLWCYSPANNETSVSEPLPEELLEINPLYILNQYASRYTVKKLSPLGKNERVELQARKSSMAVKRAVLVVDPATKLPSAIDVTFSNSARMNIVISSVTTGKALPKTAFTYPKAKYPKAEVVDLR